MRRKRTITEVYDSIFEIINKTFVKLAPDILIKTDWGTVVYNRYLIRSNGNIIDVVSRATDSVHDFGSVKMALMWAIFDHHGRIADATRIKHIDKIVEGINADIVVHRQIVERSTGESYFITHAKLQHDLWRQRQFLREVDKYTILAQQLCDHKRK